MNSIVMTLLFTTTMMYGCSVKQVAPVTLAGTTEERTFSVSEFTKLNVHSALEVIVCDSVSDIHVETDINLFPYLQISQTGKSLSIGYRNGTNWVGTTVNRVLIPSQKGLDKIAVSGASHVTIERTIDASEVDIDMSGASVLSATIASAEADINASGSSVIDLRGTINQLEVGISGASQLISEKNDDKYSLCANDITGTLSGSSQLYVHSDGTIRCGVSGASCIFYTGNAVTSDSNCTGASIIIHE
ncbi:MAG: GIN domain-containing protein [Paludibacteraceae bacterium]